MRRGGRLGWRLGVGCLLALGALAGSPGAGRAAEVPARLWTALELARPTERVEAADFTLPDLAGKAVRLSDFRGRVVLLYFWTTW